MLAQALPIALLTALATLLGGSSSGGALGNAGIQIVAAALLAWYIARPAPREATAPERRLQSIFWFALVLTGLQAIPLPPAIWPALPLHDVPAQSFELLGLALPWMPLTLDPLGTLSSALMLLTMIAIVMAVARVDRPAIIAAVLPIIAILSLGVLMGVAQAADGANSRFYFYAITNRGAGVGFFANANHFGTASLALVAFAAAAAPRPDSDLRHSSRAVLRIGVAITMSLLGVLGAMVSGSLAAIALIVPVIAVSVFAYRGRNIAFNLRLLAIAAVVVAIFMAAALTSPLINDFDQAPVSEGAMGRSAIWATTMRAIGSSHMFGTGLGSFQAVYPLFEDAGAVTSIYASHAHNDLLELILEAGLPGVLLLILFLLWWSRATLAIWRERSDVFARAATIVTATILVHSLVDYPLRTAAVQVLFALSCALMAQGSRVTAVRPREEAQPARHLGV
jgi:O-antigen ligase